MFLVVFGKEPNIVVTDLDATMRKVVTIGFKSAWHRLRMWHIGGKLNDKVFESNI